MTFLDNDPSFNYQSEKFQETSQSGSGTICLDDRVQFFFSILLQLNVIRTLYARATSQGHVST